MSLQHIYPFDDFIGRLEVGTIARRPVLIDTMLLIRMLNDRTRFEDYIAPLRLPSNRINITTSEFNIREVENGIRNMRQEMRQTKRAEFYDGIRRFNIHRTPLKRSDLQFLSRWIDKYGPETVFSPRRLFDTFIALVAKANGYYVLTENDDDFTFPDAPDLVVARLHV